MASSPVFNLADVTVVIPAYNSSGTIARALRSVLAQTLLPAEIIVIDDASLDSDALKAELESLEIPLGVQLRLLHNKTNLNGAATRNRGIIAATAGTIAFLDADDEWNGDKLALCLDAMARTDGPAMVYSQVCVVQNHLTCSVRPARGISPREHMSEYLFLSGGFVQTSTIVCSREIATKVQFDPAFRRHQDYDFCLRTAAEGVTVVFVDRPLVRYHSSAGVFSQRSEDPEYTRIWGDTMRPYMSRHGYFGFRFFLISGRLAAEGRYGAALSNALIHAMLLGPVGIWKARAKASAVIRVLLGR